jgi:glycosyltransferase involved in cell wall biosynthesis
MSQGFTGLRVMLVGPVPPPHGGMANQTLQLERLLRSEGAIVERVEVNPPYRPAWIGRVPVVRAAARLLPYVVRLGRVAARSDVVHILASSGWSWHLFAAPAVWIGTWRGAPVVVNYRGGGAAEFFGRSMRWIRPTLVRCSAIIVPSPFLQRIFAEHGFRAEVVPNVIDLARFAPADDSENAPGAGPRLLVARNLEDVYDIGTALRAFAILRRSLPGARLWVAGSGPTRDALGDLARELGIADAVEFTGRLENERMAALYRRADLVLNPSLADNMPISILEALASGVPVVSTNVGGIPDLVTDGVTAVLVRPSDAEAMARETLRLLNDPERMRRQRRAGRELVRNFEWSEVRARLLAAYGGAREAAGRS